MISRLFLELTEYAWFRRLAWKPIYNLLAKRFPIEHWHFMNYGYVPNENETPLVLPTEEEKHRYPLQLYHFLATKTEIAAKDVLEVGSGRGGGSRYIASYLNPIAMTGMDLAQHAVDFSIKHHKAANLRYVQGNAEKLPFADNSFDVVINVESCHAYGSVSSFLNEVKRVLRPGGYLCITDMRGKEGMEKLQGELAGSGMTKIFEDDISMQVVKAIEAEDESKRALIAKLIPASWHGAFNEFSGVTGSQIHVQLKSEKLNYYRWVLKKT